MTLSVADRLEILEVVTRADQAASDRDAAAYVQLFTEDAVLDGAEGRHAGRAALQAAVGPVWAAEGPVTLHLTLNPVIEDLDDDQGRRVAVRSVLLIVAPGPPAVLRTAAAITQVLVRRNGSWHIQSRTVGGHRPAVVGTVT
jgi:uncharacterized protein (TIGR02246 family)